MPVRDTHAFISRLPARKSRWDRRALTLRQRAVQLPAGKTAHFIGGAIPPAGAAGELTRRKMIWIEALIRCARLTQGANNLRSKFDDPDHFKSFSAPNDAADTLMSANAAAQMAVITFMTVFNVGYQAPGLVAGNTEPAVDAARQATVAQVFAAPSERATFDAFQSRLRSLRDGLLAHSDGGTQQFEEAAGATSFRPDCRVSTDDLMQLGDFAMKLQKALILTLNA